MPHFSTQLKIALGYLLLTILLIATIGYIYTEMHSLTRTDESDTILSQRLDCFSVLKGFSETFFILLLYLNYAAKLR